MTIRLFIKLNRANIITISPADLKKIPDFELFFMLNELKLIKASTGSVPRAKENIVSPPSRKLFTASVEICID